ncbi:hypothetical protein OG613_22460 [Streptomyces sp. NBC_00015]|uniref:hypothetical protein n=1 Tax=unclassified Streptomyces TaxID=2593676 RepID=UPI0022567F93|nr:hypothetical protein [Streptomyces sp. NBC_00103]MCX5369504.1 hypothetical protein [Streptomyces sp. NBC_00103]
MSPAARLPRSHTWLRTLVLLLALLVPGAAAEVSATPVAAAELAEYDVLDTPLRPAPCAHRTAAPLRPAALPAPAPGVPADPPRPAPHRPSYALHALRTVVLRC